MPRRATWLPHPRLSLLLLLIWLLLNDSLAPGHILLGSTLGLIIPLFTQRFWPDRAHLRRPLLAIQLIGRVLLDIIIANFAVTRVVLGPREGIKPAFVRVPLDVKGAFGVTTLASVISLTPGTVSAELDPEQRHLLVHALSEEDPERLVEQIKIRYEAPIKEIFAC
jgi:multicomponent K+:H+ antiporter subunit E